MSALQDIVLTLSCPDAPGIVHRVSQVLHEAGCNIVESQQYGDVFEADASGRFFMRVHVQALAENDGAAGDVLETLQQRFAPTAQALKMQHSFHALGQRPRVMLLVSRFGHCLNDLLYRWHNRQLPVDVACVVSNHPDFEALARHYGLPWYHLPLAPGSDHAAKRAQEQRIEALIHDHQVDTVVLARYMQILSPEFCQVLSGRAINIHHSFLPSFKGARPYAQAHARGVKIIGATAHYVTTDLDEGPIIEQDVERVDHRLTVEDLTAVGRDIECRVLARALRWHAERRVLINGQRTVVFR
ncbi:formyltetrahydrofolate deformylase [Amphibiibacter pelophylacis]|uniref:Formyltetrahydrofolate deformylase n=1 Tax=Amphibiibacter pelophylacis TaxID=1799477 RepID=A0ACC6P0J5_9BURK